MPAEQTRAASAVVPEDAPGRVRISGIQTRPGHLAPGEALIDRIFETVTASFAAAGVDRSDIDSVVLAADDLADGRSITTMLHATAAGAYRNDELRVTNGSLVAVGLAALRVTAGLSGRCLVASWWAPTAGSAPLAAASVGVRDHYKFLSPDRFVEEPTGAGCAACIVDAGIAADGLDLEAFAWAQADFGKWLAHDVEPAGVQARLGADLSARCGGLDNRGVAVASATAAEKSWHVAAEASGVGSAWRWLERGDHVGIADGLFLLADLTAALSPGEQGIALATGSPQFLVAEGVSVRRANA
jgi:hypothetical protein